MFICRCSAPPMASRPPPAPASPPRPRRSWSAISVAYKRPRRLFAMGLLARAQALITTGGQRRTGAIGPRSNCWTRPPPPPRRPGRVWCTASGCDALIGRRDARDQLRAAHHMFEAMDAQAFCERARLELHATGERARPASLPGRVRISPHEKRRWRAWPRAARWTRRSRPGCSLARTRSITTCERCTGSSASPRRRRLAGTLAAGASEATPTVPGSDAAEDNPA